MPAHVVLVGEEAPSPKTTDALKHARRWVIMVPGISSGDRAQSCRLLEAVRGDAPDALGIFYEWGGGDPTRKVASPLATARAGASLARLLAMPADGAGEGCVIDVIAHSAGTIVINKAAGDLREARAPVRLRHVLFLGTPHDPGVDLTALKSRSAAVLNVHSAYDKINRNVSDDLGHLQALPGGGYWNVRMDTSLGGRLIRHYAFLEDNPENRVQYRAFLDRGTWPEALPLPAQVDGKLDCERLQRFACGLRAAVPDPALRDACLPWTDACLAAADPACVYYGVLFAGILRERSRADALKAVLARPEAPGYLRREVYPALGNLERPEDVRFLLRKRGEDPEGGEVLRDVLRALKRNRIR